MGSVALDHAATHDHYTRLQRKMGAINPDTKLIRDELAKKFEDHDAKWEKRFSDHDNTWEQRFSERDDNWERKFADLKIAQDARVSTLERSASAFDSWRPEIDRLVDDVRLEVGKLSKHWERAVFTRPRTPLLPTSLSRGEIRGGQAMP